VSVRIWKFPLAITGEQMITMPKGTAILSVQMQGNQLSLWALVNERYDDSPCRVHIVGTGHPADHVLAMPFVGTVQDGPYVWHVFAEPDTESTA
jgi:hypothetical protein